MRKTPDYNKNPRWIKRDPKHVQRGHMGRNAAGRTYRTPKKTK